MIVNKNQIFKSVYSVGSRVAVHWHERWAEGERGSEMHERLKNTSATKKIKKSQKHNFTMLILDMDMNLPALDNCLLFVSFTLETNYPQRC